MDPGYKLRNDWLGAPNYPSVLLLGTTGSGKTTLLRQLIGSDPERDGFPATSAGKTTVSATEILACADDHYWAIVTFSSRVEVRLYLGDLVTAAALAMYDGKAPTEIRRLLLNHVDQRFRLGYVLGEGQIPDNDTTDVEDRAEDEPAPDGSGEPFLSQLEVAIRELVRVAVERARADQPYALLSDDAAFRDEVEKALDWLAFGQVVDTLETEIRTRFNLLPAGEIERDSDEWPTTWKYEDRDRSSFLQAIGPLTSNNARSFGRLLTPLVSGLRVRGPFGPIWEKHSVNYLLLDGEGLGHTPESATSLPPEVVDRLPDIDHVILVDHAGVPMQAGAAAVVSHLVATGHIRKLIVCFTHMDHVVGVNLPSFKARSNHVRESLINALQPISARFGESTGRRSHASEGIVSSTR